MKETTAYAHIKNDFARFISAGAQSLEYEDLAALSEHVTAISSITSHGNVNKLYQSEKTKFTSIITISAVTCVAALATMTPAAAQSNSVLMLSMAAAGFAVVKAHDSYQRMKSHLTVSKLPLEEHFRSSQRLIAKGLGLSTYDKQLQHNAIKDMANTSSAILEEALSRRIATDKRNTLITIRNHLSSSCDPEEADLLYRYCIDTLVSHDLKSRLTQKLETPSPEKRTKDNVLAFIDDLFNARNAGKQHENDQDALLIATNTKKYKANNLRELLYVVLQKNDIVPSLEKEDSLLSIARSIEEQRQTHNSSRYA